MGLIITLIGVPSFHFSCSCRFCSSTKIANRRLISWGYAILHGGTKSEIDATDMDVIIADIVQFQGHMRALMRMPETTSRGFLPPEAALIGDQIWYRSDPGECAFGFRVAEWPVDVGLHIPFFTEEDARLGRRSIEWHAERIGIPVTVRPSEGRAPGLICYRHLRGGIARKQRQPAGEGAWHHDPDAVPGFMPHPYDRAWSAPVGTVIDIDPRWLRWSSVQVQASRHGWLCRALDNGTDRWYRVRRVE